MNNQLQIFNHTAFGQLEILIEGDKVLFPATDCAITLGYRQPKNAIRQHCRWCVKRTLPHPQSPGKTIEKNYIPEGDLYRLIARSNLPTAEAFESWVFDEVLPTIRKTGSYSVSPEDELKRKRLEITERNARARDAQILQKAAQCSGVTATYKRLLHARAVEMVTGEMLIPYETAEKKEYSATEVAKMIGAKTAQTVGKLANLAHIKAEEGGSNEYGRWIHTKSPHSPKEVLSWVYFDEGVKVLRSLVNEGALFAVSDVSIFPNKKNGGNERGA